MDQPAPPADALVRPWRRAALIAGGIAALELAALVALAALLLSRPLLPRATASSAGERRPATAEVASPERASSPRQPQPKPAAAPRLTRARTLVVVLNGNGRAGAAAAEAERLRARGYAVAAVGNAPRLNYTRSLVLYRPGYEPEGRRLAADLGIAVVSPLDGLRRGDLKGAHALVIVGE